MTRAARPRRKPGRRGDGGWSPSSTSRWTQTPIDAGALVESHERAAHADPVARALRVARGPATAEQPERFERVCPVHLLPLDFVAPHVGRGRGLTELAQCAAGQGHTCTSFAVVDARARVVLLVSDSAGGEWLPQPVPLATWRARVVRLLLAGQAGALERGALALAAALAVDQHAGQAQGPPVAQRRATDPHGVASGQPAAQGGGGA